MKTVAELKEQIKSSIETRTRFAVRDVHTLMRAKSSPDLLKMSGDFNDYLGGGNFLSAMAGIVLLESFATTYACLADKTRVVRDCDVAELRERRAQFCIDTKVSKTKLNSLELWSPRTGTAKNVDLCIRSLEERIEAEISINLGYRAVADKYPSLWSLFRNNLAHRLAPGWGAAAGGVDPGWLSSSPSLENDLRWFGRYNLPVFSEHDNGTVFVTGEFLVLAYLPRISIWLNGHVDLCDDIESLQLAAANNLVSLE